MTFSRGSAVLTVTRWVHRLVDAALIVAIVAPLVLFALQFQHSDRLDNTRLIQGLYRWGDPVIIRAASWFKLSWPPPRQIHGPEPPPKSLLPLGVAFGVWLLKIGVDALLLRGQRLLGGIPAPGPAGAGSGLPGDPGAITADSERARAELLKRYREIESALKAAKRKRCAFLSIDVVGSTQMKVGERETDVSATFQAYTEMLKEIFEQYGAWKVAWTPDGVMVCFLQLDLAVAAGQRLLQKLKHFNEAENRLRTPFRVRCGLNLGEVPIFEDSRLESVADRVIDVAGHMQKQSTPNALWLSAQICNLLADKSGFRATGQAVDGYEAYEWSAEALESTDKTGL